jgi:hypothetical protein
MDEKKRVGRPAESEEPKLGFRLRADAAKRLAELQNSVQAADRPRPSQEAMISGLILAMEKRGDSLWKQLRKSGTA